MICSSELKSGKIDIWTQRGNRGDTRLLRSYPIYCSYALVPGMRRYDDGVNVFEINILFLRQGWIDPHAFHMIATRIENFCKNPTDNLGPLVVKISSVLDAMK
jgi:hypothetical protein